MEKAIDHSVSSVNEQYKMCCVAVNRDRQYSWIFTWSLFDLLNVNPSNPTSVSHLLAINN